MNKRISSLAVVGVSAVAMGTVAAGLPAKAASTVAAPASLSTMPDPSWWGTNGRVTDIKHVGSRVYLSGAFDYIGPQTGYGVRVSPTSGVMASTSPKIDGVVTASAPDGAGGWYVVGSFTHVGSTFRRGAAQIDADGNVTRWNPAPKGRPTSIAVLSDKVVIGGNITAIGKGSAANDLVAVDRTKGQPVSGWRASTNGEVDSILPTTQGLLVGGTFSVVSGSAATGLARVTTTDGSFDPSFTGRVRGSVSALAATADGSTVVAGGDFSQVSGSGQTVTRSNLAGFSAAGGTPSSWSTGTNGEVNALATDTTNGSIVVGGDFTTLGGLARVAAGAISGTGAVVGFNPALSGCNTPHKKKDTYTLVPCTTEVMTVSAGGGTVYLGGRFGASGSTERHNAVAFTSGSSTPNAWNPVASGPVLTVGVSSASLFVGGDLTSVNGLVRKGLAALNATTGAGDPSFRVDADNIVLDIEPSTDQSKLYVMGSFATLGGLDRKDIAAIDIPSGTVDTSFKAQANNTAIVGRYAAGSLYVGGVFKRVNNVARAHLVKLNGSTGAVDQTFVVNTSGPTGALKRGGMVQGLAVRSDGSRVYLAGPFTSANGVAVTGGLLVVNGSTGARTTAQLGGVESCPKVGPWITYLALSPDQNYLYGGDTCPDFIYKWDAVNLGTTQNPTGMTWITWCDGGMQALAEVNGRLYYGTHGIVCWQSPTSKVKVERPRLASFDATTSALTSDKYFFDSPMGVWALEPMPQGLLVGGDFTLVGDRNTVDQGLALLPGTP
ncbi:exported hypothetical protein [Nostocoides japonicum T1-X7]|uniref:Uncharacterized protein n=1 Tax=Nostocoides japonicum T1-X7 TaxID=1194083 RepID=A0A077M1R8_9MICO|nr:delta-60 repeat domain-containing protein [Tetrasphaera japonica]CCH78154.1 exported hypothetical protein [Tetrasphaera japonica T1-X7]